jgi:RNA 2',3'-cyclic 3'-phosphodiesterase
MGLVIEPGYYFPAATQQKRLNIMPVIRAFIAIDLPSHIQEKLSDILNQLKRPDTMAVRWVPARNIHLTIKFLGDVSPSNLEILTKILQSEVSRYKPFEIRVASLGAFPSMRRPRVVWVGVEAPSVLQSLQRAVEVETVRLGYAAEDRPFSPHLTLGRVAHNASPEEVRQVADVLVNCKVGELGTALVDQVRLFRSDLQPGGAVYTPLFTTPMGK